MITLSATECVLLVPFLSPGTWILTPQPLDTDPDNCVCVEGLGATSGTMTMDGLETCTPPPHRPHSAFLLSESAAFNVLSFDTCLLKGAPPIPGGSSPPPAARPPTQGDLNTPVTTAGELPSFFGPASLVEPPPISGKNSH